MYIAMTRSVYDFVGSLVACSVCLYEEEGEEEELKAAFDVAPARDNGALVRGRLRARLGGDLGLVLRLRGREPGVHGLVGVRELVDVVRAHVREHLLGRQVRVDAVRAVRRDRRRGVHPRVRDAGGGHHGESDVVSRGVARRGQGVRR